MHLAIELASSCCSSGLPIAAIISDSSGAVLSRGRNETDSGEDVTSHAELVAIRELQLASRRAEARDLILTVTLEPCPMCAWAIRLFGIGKVVFGAYNDQYGAAGSVLDLLRDSRFGRPVEVVGGVLDRTCSSLLDRAFFEIRNNRTW